MHRSEGSSHTQWAPSAAHYGVCGRSGHHSRLGVCAQDREIRTETPAGRRRCRSEMTQPKLATLSHFLSVIVLSPSVGNHRGWRLRCIVIRLLSLEGPSSVICSRRVVLHLRCRLQRLHSSVEVQTDLPRRNEKGTPYSLVSTRLGIFPRGSTDSVGIGALFS